MSKNWWRMGRFWCARPAWGHPIMSDIQKMWELLDETGGDQLCARMYEKGDTERPFRLIVFVNGKDAVARVLSQIGEAANHG